MTLYPRSQEDLGTAEGIISHLGAIIDGTATLDQLNFPKDGNSVVSQLKPAQARKILSDAGVSE